MKRYHRYLVDFQSKALWLSGICMGLPIFLLVFYYAFLQEFTQIPVGTLVLRLWIPVGLCVIYLALTRVIHWNSPGALAIVGAAFCLLLMIQVFGTGNVLRIILGVLGYLACGALLILCAGGFLPGRIPASFAFAAVVLVRLLCFSLATVKGWNWLTEIPSLCIIAGLMFLPVSFKEGKKR